MEDQPKLEKTCKICEWAESDCSCTVTPEQEAKAYEFAMNHLHGYGDESRTLMTLLIMIKNLQVELETKEANYQTVAQKISRDAEALELENRKLCREVHNERNRAHVLTLKLGLSEEQSPLKYATLFDLAKRAKHPLTCGWYSMVACSCGLDALRKEVGLKELDLVHLSYAGQHKCGNVESTGACCTFDRDSVTCLKCEVKS